jgi:hypothetical protein
MHMSVFYGEAVLGQLYNNYYLYNLRQIKHLFVFEMYYLLPKNNLKQVVNKESMM